VLSVDNVKPTVPAYEFLEVIVIVEMPLLPCEAVTLVADIVKVALEELDEPTVNVIEPVEAAYVASPEYVAVMT